MRTISFEATQAASSIRPLRRNELDDLAADLIKAGYIYDDQYLEMRHLDPKWMVAFYLYSVALWRALGGQPGISP